MSFIKCSSPTAYESLEAAMTSLTSPTAKATSVCTPSSALASRALSLHAEAPVSPLTEVSVARAQLAVIGGRSDLSSCSSSSPLPDMAAPPSAGKRMIFYPTHSDLSINFVKSIITYCSPSDAWHYSHINRCCGGKRTNILLINLEERRNPANRIGLSLDSLAEFTSYFAIHPRPEDSRGCCAINRKVAANWQALLSHCSELTALRSARRKDVENNDQSMIARLLVKNCTKLTHVRFLASWIYRLDYSTLYLIRHSRNLRSLDFGSIVLSNLTCSSISDAIRGRELSITSLNCRISRMTELGFRTLVRACPDLENADFTGSGFTRCGPRATEHITYDDHPNLVAAHDITRCGLTVGNARALTEACPKLTTLRYGDLGEDVPSPPEAFEIIARGLKCLTSLKPQVYCLTETNWREMAPELSQLKRLAPCCSVDDWLWEFVPILPTLSIFDCSGYEITAKGLTYLAKNFPNLTEIHCRACNVSAKELDELRGLYPRVKFIA